MHDLLIGIAKAVITPQLVVDCACALVGLGATAWIAHRKAATDKDGRIDMNAIFIRVADQTLEDAIKAGGDGQLTRQAILQRALLAAERDIVANKPELVAASEFDWRGLIHGRQSTQLAPGGAVVTLPGGAA